MLDPVRINMVFLSLLLLLLGFPEAPNSMLNSAFSDTLEVAEVCVFETIHGSKVSSAALLSVIGFALCFRFGCLIRKSTTLLAMAGLGPLLG